MDIDNCDKPEESLKLQLKANKTQLTWQLKALLAGRTPLPTSRPKRKVDEIDNRESSEDSFSSREDERCATSSENAHSEDEKEDSLAVHVAKRPKLSSLKASRKQWKLEEIRHVIAMRKDEMAWEKILEHFPGRTIVGVRQIFWKYNSSYDTY
ncbi:hypothetical protein ACHAQJ_003397 [Trichoderma viride]